MSILITLFIWLSLGILVLKLCYHPKVIEHMYEPDGMEKLLCVLFWPITIFVALWYIIDVETQLENFLKWDD